MLLGVAARMGETRISLADPKGVIQKRYSDLSCLSGLDWSEMRLALCYTRERQAELESWLAELPPHLEIYQTGWPDAALAGAFGGRPGVLLSTEHWTMYAGCACENGPEPICQALAMAREANHRTLVMAGGEGGLEWLSREAMKLLEEVGGLSVPRLRRSLGKWSGPRSDMASMRERAVAVRAALEDLAAYPGPDPAALALLAKAARRLSDLLRRLTSRVRLGNPTRAAWLDGRLEGPLWEPMAVEFEKYLPELRWQAPLDTPDVGVLWLALGALKETERRAMNPQGPPPAPLAPGLRKLDADAWRQLSRWSGVR